VHLYHGAWSLFQRLGWHNPRFNQARKRFATAFAAIVLIGNVSFPIMVTAGVIEADDHHRPDKTEESQVNRPRQATSPTEGR
jgi:succinate dehydrogenase / fumarate reductase cytochrome b subunit